MNISKLLTTAVTAVAFVSVIGLAYAQSSPNSSGTSTSSEQDSKYVAPMMDASAMPQPTTTDATATAPADASAPLPELAARTDRN
jgi:hypothetical protein